METQKHQTEAASRLLSGYGAAIPEKGWIPAPRYILRRYRILRLLDPLPRGKLLEIGCGAGALLNDLSRMGFSCKAVETSPAASSLARYLNRGDPNVTVFSRIQPGWKETFDYVLSFEVLEHIQEDRDALIRWTSCLKPGGRLFLSVPARKKRWSAADVHVGHFRRYEREALHRLLCQTGLTVEHFESYGFPLSNIVEPIRAIHYAKLMRRNPNGRIPGDPRKARTEQSGIKRDLETRLYPLIDNRLARCMMLLCCRLQGLFLRTDLGTGYLVVGRRLAWTGVRNERFY